MKLQSILDTDYPIDKLQVLIGSDASTDSSNRILLEAQRKHPQIEVSIFPKRTGKPGLVNELVKKARGQIFVLTDANVFFDKHTISGLVQNFSDPNVGLVDGVMLNKRVQTGGISIPESHYISRETRIKYLEGQLWGTMMGPFGGCFALRAELYSTVPANFIADDFYLAMRVFEQGKRSINELSAKAYEDVSNSLWEEYRRKVRISAGNFQNLLRFKSLLFSTVKGLSYAFWSHKLLRWLGPFLLILLYFCSWSLTSEQAFYLYAFYLQSLLFLIPVMDLILQRLGIQLLALRYLTHFYVMNLALLAGFFKFAKGVQTNVWEPTKRSQ